MKVTFALCKSICIFNFRFEKQISDFKRIFVWIYKHAFV